MERHLRDINPFDSEAMKITAAAHEKANNLPRAVQLLEGAARLNKKDMGVRARLVRLYTLVGRHAESESLANEVLRLDGKASEVRFARALARIKMNEPRSALIDLLHLTSKQPANRQFQIALAEAYFLSGQPARTVAVLKKMVSIAPLSALLHERYGDALVALGKTRMAEEEYVVALRKRPDLHHIYSKKAELELRHGNYVGARDSLETVIASGHGNTSHKLQLAKVIESEGESGAALFRLKEWWAKDSSDESMAVAYAEMLYASGYADESKHILQQYCDDHSGSIHGAAALAKISAVTPVAVTDNNSASQNNTEVPALSEPVVQIVATQERMPASAQPEVRRERVRAGETLMTMSFRLYGTHKMWRALLRANRSEISNANIIPKEQLLVVPERPVATTSLAR